MALKNKRILITAGPTWVPIDSVRVISNIATGETGFLLAKKLVRQGARVTLLLGPVSRLQIPKGIRCVPFRYFDELREILGKELDSKGYDVVIHSAAVADYQPVKPVRGKISSCRSRFRLALKPTGKIINGIKKISPASFVVGFKYEPQAKAADLMRKAGSLLDKSKVDMVIANTLHKGRYQAYLVDAAGQKGPFCSKAALVVHLIARFKGAI